MEALRVIRRQLAATRVLEDLPRLAEVLGCQRQWQEIPPAFWSRRPGDPSPHSRSALIAKLGELPWYAVTTGVPVRAAKKLAGVLHRRGEAAAVFALDETSGALALSVAFAGFPVLSLVPAQDDSVLSACFARIREARADGRLATAARLADILGLEGLGIRFFNAFEKQLDCMAGALTGCRSADRRSLALLQLNRVLFLYFVQSKGWLNGQPDFLHRQVDLCLGRKRGLDRQLLRPLFFGTLNRPLDERSSTTLALGHIPYLNGGLFEPHPLERKWKGTIPNAVWRDAFDRVFERFHFTASEGSSTAIAPDMLGRVFEGVMAPDERRRSGTFFTPPALVRTLLEECLAVWISREAGVSVARAADSMRDRDPATRSRLGAITLLDPAAGSGAFLLAALERLGELTRSGDESVTAARRRVLQSNLFGVDINPTAVRLTELRLWLSVIAEDPTESADQVAPLPNLDCLVRQGDSLADPLGALARMPYRPGAMGPAMSSLRRAFSGAAGRDKRHAARVLRAAETSAMQACLDLAERTLNSRIGEVLRTARTPDLFGERRGADRATSRHISQLRRQLWPVRLARRRLAEHGEIGWFQYEAHYADVFSDRGGFDLVLGNPPWVRAEKLAPAVREHLSARYCWWRTESGAQAGYRHQPDLAVAFLERAHELARPGGVVGLLIPAKLGTAAYGSAARRAITRDLTIHAIAELGSTHPSVFDATVYPMALVTTKERPRAEQRVRLSLGVGGAAMAQAELAGGGPWIIRKAGTAAIARELATRFPPLRAQHPIQLGVKTGANGIFLNPPPSIEPELVRRAFRGRDVRPFKIIRSTPLLWPCTRSGGPLPELPPAASAWFATHRRALLARSDQREGPPWMVFRTAAATPGAKVVWADLSRTLTAAALDDDDGRIPLNTCYVLRAPRGQNVVIAAWLNSSWMRGLALAQADPASSGFARFNARTVGALPCPPSLAGDAGLTQWARQALSGHFLQAELDELTAPHLDLTPAELRTLASVA
jgi:hypothetical protein